MLSWAFKATIYFQFSIQSHHLLITRHSEPSSLLSNDVQSRLSQFNIQRCQFSVMVFKVFIFFSSAFRVAIYSQLRHLESSFSVRHSESSFLVLAFRAVRSSQFGLQSRISSLAFKATISFQFSIQSHHIFSVWRSKPPSLFSLAFRVTVPSQFGVQSHYPITIGHSLPHFRRSELHSWHSELSFIVWSSELHSWRSILPFTVWSSKPSSIPGI